MSELLMSEAPTVEEDAVLRVACEACSYSEAVVVADESEVAQALNRFFDDHLSGSAIILITAGASIIPEPRAEG